MPRNFSEADRDSIRAALIAAGRSCFLRYGLRRTKVEELAESAGIAKGTFYHFFSSKEDLCMEIFDIEERAMKEHVAGLMAAHKDARETVEALLRYGIGFATGDSLLVVLRDSGEYALLARGVPPETLARHIQNDFTLAERFLADLRSPSGSNTAHVSPARDRRRRVFRCCRSDDRLDFARSGVRGEQ
jgi:AcrR family transcriptional regulator